MGTKAVLSLRICFACWSQYGCFNLYAHHVAGLPHLCPYSSLVQQHDRPRILARCASILFLVVWLMVSVAVQAHVLDCLLQGFHVARRIVIFPSAVAHRTQRQVMPQLRLGEHLTQVHRLFLETIHSLVERQQLVLGRANGMGQRVTSGDNRCRLSRGLDFGLCGSAWCDW